MKTKPSQATELRKLRAVLREAERMTAVGPPSPPGLQTPGSGWYNLLVRVNAKLRHALPRAAAPLGAK